MTRQQPRSPLFPYTTLFRSKRRPACLSAPEDADADAQEARHKQEVPGRSEEHTSELQSHHDLVCRLLLEKKKINYLTAYILIVFLLLSSMPFFFFFVLLSDR